MSTTHYINFEDAEAFGMAYFGNENALRGTPNAAIDVVREGLSLAVKRYAEDGREAAAALALERADQTVYVYATRKLLALASLLGNDEAFKRLKQ